MGSIRWSGRWGRGCDSREWGRQKVGPAGQGSRSEATDIIVQRRYFDERQTREGIRSEGVGAKAAQNEGERREGVKNWTKEGRGMPPRRCIRRIGAPSRETVGKQKCHPSYLLELHGCEVGFLPGASSNDPLPWPQRIPLPFQGGGQASKEPKVYEAAEREDAPMSQIGVSHETEASSPSSQAGAGSHTSHPPSRNAEIPVDLAGHWVFGLRFLHRHFFL